MRGQTDEAASVSVSANQGARVPATTEMNNGFHAMVPVSVGNNTLTIKATDTSPNKNQTTRNYQVTVQPSPSRSLSYDLAGNMLSNGQGQSYTWDAEKRLTKIIYSSNASTEFFYDGKSRRVKVIEKNSSGITLSDERFIWAGGNQPAEERDATNVVTVRYFSDGEERPTATAPANKLYYTKDHLSSVSEVTDSTGAVRASYAFDLWGNRTKLSGDLDTVVGYTGHHHHANSGLILTWYRAYDAELGRWLSRDPIAESGGINLYGYVENDPINNIDPKGLEDFDPNNNIAEVINCQQVCVELAKSVPCPDAFLKKCLQNCLDGIYPSPIDIIETPTTKPSIPNNPLKWVKFVYKIVKKIIKGE